MASARFLELLARIFWGDISRAGTMPTSPSRTQPALPSLAIIARVMRSDARVPSMTLMRYLALYQRDPRPGGQHLGEVARRSAGRQQGSGDNVREAVHRDQRRHRLPSYNHVSQDKLTEVAYATKQASSSCPMKAALSAVNAAAAGRDLPAKPFKLVDRAASAAGLLTEVTIRCCPGAGTSPAPASSHGSARFSAGPFKRAGRRWLRPDRLHCQTVPHAPRTPVAVPADEG